MSSLRLILLGAGIYGLFALTAQANSNINPFAKLLSNISIGDEKCDQCIAQIEDMRKNLVDATYVDYLRRYYTAICDILLLPQKDECLKQISAQFDEFVKVIKTTNSVDICQRINLCS